MSQHDMTLDNASGLGFRSDANNALQALASQSSGASAPSPTFPCQAWGDTGTGRLKQRNSANSAWLDMGPLDAPLRDAASQGEFVADTGAANAYVCNFVPAITARSEATPIRFKASNANTGACTINDGVGVVALVGANNAALRGGEILANGIAWIQWNTSIGGGSYVLLFCTGAAAPVAVTGSARNVKMVVTAASASATPTADEIVVKTALGGQSWLLNTFSKTINLATTGAGGMDTGTAPVSGYVAIYAIYNPATLTSALLAVNATSAAAPSIYGGANMPSGYTASGLISVWPTNASSQFKTGIQRDRRVSTLKNTVLNTSVGTGTFTTLSIAAAVPLNAISCRGDVEIGGAAGSGLNGLLAADVSGIGYQYVSLFPGNNIAGNYELSLITPQTLFYQLNTSLAPGLFVINICSYEI